MIQLPNCVWFVQKQDGEYLTNVYSGSLGTDPQKGCVNKRTFHYKAYVKTTKEDGPVSFHAECFWRSPWNEETQITDFAEKEFDNSQAGIKQAEEWLVKQYAKEKG